jgi:HEAT repeat protein
MKEGHANFGLPAESRMSITAKFELVPMAFADSDDGWMAGRLLDVAMTGDKDLFDRASLPLDTLAAALETPFMVRFDATGAAVDRRYSNDMPVGARNVVGSVLTGLQVVLPDDVDVVAGQWQAPEEGLDGPFTARYSQRSARVDKTWTRVVALDGRALDGAGGLTTQGEVAWTFGAGTTVAERGTLKVVLSGDASPAAELPMKIESETTAALVKQGIMSGAWAFALRPDMFPGRDGVADLEYKASITADPLPAPSGRSPAEIVAASGAAHEAGDSQARRSAMLDLAATIRHDPKTLVAVEGQLRGDVDGDGLRTLVEALTHANTPESLGLMNDVLKDEDAPALSRHSLALAAGTMGEPTSELVQTLMALSREPLDMVATAALLGLGVQGNRQHAGPFTEDIRNDVIARAEAVLGNEDKLDPANPGAPPAWDLEPGVIQAWLSAVGNLGGEEAWPLMAPYLKHPNEFVRHAAVAGLIYVPGRDVRMAVAEMIEIDPSHWVRRRAVQTAGNMPQSAFENIIIRTMREDDAPDVRLECARVLAVWGIENPGLYALIADAAQREPDKSTKKVMGQLQPHVISGHGLGDDAGPRVYTATPIGGAQ